MVPVRSVASEDRCSILLILLCDIDLHADLIDPQFLRKPARGREAVVPSISRGTFSRLTLRPNCYLRSCCNCLISSSLKALDAFMPFIVPPLPGN